MREESKRLERKRKCEGEEKIERGWREEERRGKKHVERGREKEEGKSSAWRDVGHLHHHDSLIVTGRREAAPYLPCHCG